MHIRVSYNERENDAIEEFLKVKSFRRCELLDYFVALFDGRTGYPASNSQDTSVMMSVADYFRSGQNVASNMRQRQ